MINRLFITSRRIIWIFIVIGTVNPYTGLIENGGPTGYLAATIMMAGLLFLAIETWGRVYAYEWSTPTNWWQKILITVPVTLLLIVYAEVWMQWLNDTIDYAVARLKRKKPDNEEECDEGTSD